MAALDKQSSADFGSFRSQVLSATDIVELIGRSVTLKRRGTKYVGLCPFHQEKTGSFNVDASKQFFHCFGCKASGTAIDFVMKRDRVEFIDALRLLADAAGLEMPQRGAGGKQKSGERQAQYEIQSAAGAYFARLLEEPVQGKAAREYLVTRGINDESVKRFQIGYAADSWDGLLRGAVGRKYLPDQLAIGGLVKKRESGQGYFDFFRNRLMFPIRDDNGRVIAFGGREMPGAENPPKYLNSPETPLFSKSKCLFGLDLAKQKIVETRTVVVVEGYTDVVMAHQFGAGNVVAPLGTALGEHHIRLLKRFADRIVLLFDADSAGDAAVERVVGLFLTQEIDIGVASMPDGLDPDEYLLAHGTENFNKLIAKASDPFDVLHRRLGRRFNANGDSLTGQQKAVEGFLKLIGDARGSGQVNQDRWGQVLVRVSKLTGVPVDLLNRRFTAPKQSRGMGGPPVSSRPEYRQAAGATDSHAGSDESGHGLSDEDLAAHSHGDASDQPTTTNPVLPVRRQLSARETAERRLLGVLLLEPGRWHDVQKHVSLQDFGDDLHHKLAEIYWSQQQDEGEPVFNEFLGALNDENLRELAVVAVQEAEMLADLGLLVAEAIGFFAEQRQRAEEQNLLSDVQRTGTDPVDDLLKKMQEKARQPNLRRI